MTSRSLYLWSMASTERRVSSAGASSTPGLAPATCRWAGWTAAALIVTSTLLTVAYQWLSPVHDLAPDEAHYWDWSRQLDWSYYSKGPLVAWLIRGADEVLGMWSIAWRGDRAAAVRFPAALCHALLLTGWYLLTVNVFRSATLALSVVGLAVCIPLVRIGAILMTIDPPFLACWCWALLAVLWGLRGRRWAWGIAAIATAVGVLAKYTMLLFPAVVTLFVLFHYRHKDGWRGLGLLYAGTVVGLLPIVYWNAQHDWVSVRHVLGQVAAVGQQAGSRFRLNGPVLFLGGQLGTMFGLWLLAFLVAAWKFSPWRDGAPAVRLLWWASFPLWLFFGLASCLKPGQANWPAPAYIAGFVLTVAWLVDYLQWGKYRREVAVAAIANSTLGLIAVVLLHFPQLYRPVLARILPPPSEREPAPVRRLDLTARLAGWKALANHLDLLREQLTPPQALPPVLCGTYWTHPGLLRFYSRGHPDTYTIGIPNRSDRHSQYDFWRPNPVADPHLFRGRTFLIVGDIGPHLLPAFERIEMPQRFTYVHNGVPLQSWTIWIAHGFRGWDRLPPFEPSY
ncbi:MAG: glycosyltransferase family 39 protein [Gemmataceae bacterium]|nr:glycosyltransferase family 39 protein [Gemmataceae bacterium]